MSKPIKGVEKRATTEVQEHCTDYYRSLLYVTQFYSHVQNSTKSLYIVGLMKALKFLLTPMDFGDPLEWDKTKHL